MSDEINLDEVELRARRQVMGAYADMERRAGEYNSSAVEMEGMVHAYIEASLVYHRQILLSTQEGRS